MLNVLFNNLKKKITLIVYRIFNSFLVFVFLKDKRNILYIENNGANGTLSNVYLHLFEMSLSN